MKYKGPINIDLTDVVESIQTELDGAIYRAVCNVGITVDKEELERALKYDRLQYDTGWHDAMIDTLQKIKSQCQVRNDCLGCEFFGCMLTGIPEEWNLEKENKND